jgi:hypothetical protein
MYCRQRRRLYYGGQIYKYYLPPLHRSSPFIGGLRCQAIQTEHGPYIAETRKNPKSSTYCLMSMRKTHSLYALVLLYRIFIFSIQFNSIQFNSIQLNIFSIQHPASIAHQTGLDEKQKLLL